ncbi:hypothetical protein RB595_008276 [Gaeumannomyces hyphopodioides]
MAAESQDLVNFTLTTAQFEQLPAETRAFLNATKSVSRSAGRRGAAIANQGPHQQAEELVQEQQKEKQLQNLLASFPQEKLPHLLTPFLAQLERQPQAKQDGSKFGYEPREADSEVNKLKDKVAQLEQRLQAKEQDEKDEQMGRLLAETDKNKRLQAEVERLRNEAENNAMLGEQQKRPGVPSPNAAAGPPALALVSLQAPTQDGQAVPANDASVQAVPDSDAGGSPSNDHDGADAGPLPVSTAAPSTANSESAGSSGSPSSPSSASSRSPPSDGQSLADTHAASSADPEGSLEIDMPDADSPSSSSGAQPPSGSPRDPNKPRELIDLDTLPPKLPIPIPNPPKYDQGPHKARLDNLIKWGKTNFQQQLNVSDFNPGEFIGVWAFDALFPQSSYPKFVYDGSEGLGLPWLEKAFDKAKDKCFLIILCHVQRSNQQSKVELDHFVMAIVDWRQGNPGTFTHWGMDENLAEELRKASRDELARLLGQPGGWPSLENISHDLNHDGNTCLLGCMTAVRSFFGEENNIPPKKDGPSALRYFYLRQVLEVKSAETQAADHPPQSTSHHGGPTTAELLPAAPSDPRGQRGDEVTTERSSAAPLTSTTFRPTRKQLPDGRTRSQVDAAPQAQPTSVPPPPSGQGNNNPATPHKGVKYQWKPCEGGEILVLEPSPDQYSDLKEGPEDTRPLLFTVAEELGARDRGAVVIKIPEECRPVLPPQSAQTKKCTTYKPMPVKDDFWRLYTVYKTQTLPCLNHDSSGVDSSLDVAVREHKRRISKASEEDLESIEGVAYLTDIPAHSAKEREDALLPLESPIWHIRDNRLPREGVPGLPCVPGLHTPTAYRGTTSAPFAWHFEDLKLGAINVLYIGRKVWFITETVSFDKVTDVFSNALEVKADHDQFLRHQALHGGIEHLRNNGVSTIGFVQEPWEMVIVYPGAYHSGFSVTGTLAEAVNYADPLYTYPKGYKPCDKRCDKHQEPITCELVFPPEAETILAGRGAAGSVLRRSSRQVPTLLSTPAKDSMGSPRGPHKRKRSAGEQGLARHTGQKNSEPHEPEDGQDGLQDEPPAKQKKNTPSPQAIAEELTGPHAKERIIRYAKSWKEWHSSLVLPTLANRQTQPHDATSEGSKYLELGWDWEEKSEISKMVGALLATHGLGKLYENMPEGMYDRSGRVKQLPRALSDQARAGLRASLSDDAFRSKLKRLRKFLKIGEDYLPFMSCGGLASSSAALGHIERLADDEIVELREKLDSNPKAKTFAAMGREFRTMILNTLDHEPDTTHIDRVLELLAGSQNGWG